MKDFALYLLVSMLITLNIFWVISCICPAPQVVDGKITANADGSTDFERTTPGRAKGAIDEALGSKGFKRYKADVAQQSAKHWIDISFWASIGAGLFLLSWYFTKIKELGGAAVICVLFSLFAVAMAELVGIMLWLMLAFVGVIAVGMGILLRNKSALEWAKTKWSQGRRSN
jgi:hypothetical protein